jgi:hypothetical protein
MPGPLDNPREFREFVQAKKIRREPLIITAQARAEADFKPVDDRSFWEFVGRLRGVSSWGQAVEQLDAVNHALRKRHGVSIPFPRLLMQNDAGSLTFFWGTDLVLGCFPQGCAFTFLGRRERLTFGQESERVLLDALRARCKRQSWRS